MDPTPDHRPAEPSITVPSSLAGWLGVVGAVVALLSSAGTYSVLRYRVDQMELVHTKDAVEAAKGREKSEAVHDRLSSEIQSLQRDHGQRLVVLEERYAEIRSLLASIDRKLDEQARRGRRVEER